MCCGSTSLFSFNVQYLGQDEQCFAIIPGHLRLQVMNHRSSSFLNETAQYREFRNSLDTLHHEQLPPNQWNYKMLCVEDTDLQGMLQTWLWSVCWISRQRFLSACSLWSLRPVCGAHKILLFWHSLHHTYTEHQVLFLDHNVSIFQTNLKQNKSV